MKNLMILSLIVVILSACTKNEGEGPIVTQTLDVAAFSKLELDDSFDVIVSEGATQEVIAEGQQNIIDKLKLNVTNDRLKLGLENGIYKNFDLTIFITTPVLSDIKNDGSGDIKSAVNFNGENITLDLDGSGNIEITGSVKATNKMEVDVDGSGDILLSNVETALAKLLIDGSGKMTINGVADRTEIEIDGSGDILGFNLETDECLIQIDDSGTCEVFVRNVLDVDIDGSGDVYFKGSPTVVQQIDGSGRVVDAN